MPPPVPPSVPSLVVYTRRPVPRLERLARDLLVAALLRRSQDAGPAAVAASLRRGLRALKVGVRWNPPSAPSGSSVAVLSDPEALKAAIAWRRSGRIARLIAGPNLVATPHDHGGLVTAPEIDVYLVPSQWTADYFLHEAPTLAGRIAIWAAGVDPMAFKPSAGKPVKRAILYRKPIPGQANPSEGEVAAVSDVLVREGWAVTSLDYGGHSRRRYRDLLADSSLLVFFSPTESQGIALHEAWAMDVPTLVWEGGSLLVDGRRFASSSAPYLSERTGAFFGSSTEFEGRLTDLRNGALLPRPRAWIEEHGSDTVSAAAFLDLLLPLPNGQTAAHR